MPAAAHRPFITVVTCLRDEGPFLVDWIAHLRGIGVTCVLAFTNDCRDGTEALVEALAPAGVVHVPQGALLGRGGAKPQWRAMAAAWEHAACAGAEWLAHLDPDEFVALEGAADLPELLVGMPQAQAVTLPWRLFGCDGQLEAGAAPTPERFGRAAPPGLAYPGHGSFFKTVFRRDGPFTGFGVHRPRQSAVPAFFDDTGARDDMLAAAEKRILLWRAGVRPEGRRVQLNHYSVRSAQEFLVKRERGLPNHVGKAIDLEYWVERNFNDVRCDLIAPQLPAMAVEAARLRALPGVAEAERTARAWHGAALDRILRTLDGVRLYGLLAMAASSRTPAPPLGRALVSLYSRAHAAAGG